ncbi:hypothetical protein LIER_04778 [Lithospermum erythrorhizon]|uniref:Uncharacterized protein n=1 Tax=Lithospermum erythrorhizon TaxID=34254 RepID=A0AAV3P234_LITER
MPFHVLHLAAIMKKVFKKNYIPGLRFVLTKRNRRMKEI